MDDGETLLTGPYQERARNMIGLINQLRDLSAQLDLDLPTIVVAGNQSILEALCGVKLPRGDGTCTRSVVELRMAARISSEQQWRCVVGIRKEFDAAGMPLASVATNGISMETTEPAEVELLIRRAQKMLLNPSADPAKYLQASPYDLSRADELLFTPNIVCVEISGASVDLALIDLPGIIQSVQSTQDMKMIGMIEGLVKSHIARPRSLILAVFTCKDEMENQVIFHMAREVDPTGSRTIGVLTKPDTIESGTHEKWVSILLGSQYSLKLGYFMVKLPSKQEMEQCGTNEKVLELEESFFSASAIWGPIRNRSDRFGIVSLRLELGSLLTGLIESSLPYMKHSTEAALDEVNQALDSMPPIPGGDGKIELLQTIRHFSTLVNYHINAQQNLKVFNQKIRRHYDSFKESVLQTRPKYIHRDTAAPAAAPVSSGGFWKRSDPPKVSPKSSPDNSSSQLLSLDDLKAIVNGQKGRELDGHSPYGAFEHLVKKSQTDWRAHALTLIANVSNELGNLLAKLCEEVFGRFPNLRVQVR
ncbi:hypothetical protein HDU91_005915 [Kappamyces sp. JEL0680]|nr:hypothetical protein HDU91_005915 [Kappamyces sp. JEL0680]